MIIQIFVMFDHVYLPNDFSGKWIPAKSAVILATTKQQLGILLTPGNRQHALGVASQYLLLQNSKTSL
jgi:hypothetical protein